MKTPREMTDEELFYELRYQVNRSRNMLGHDRQKTQAIAEEMSRRGWGKTPPVDNQRNGQ